MAEDLNLDVDELKRITAAFQSLIGEIKDPSLIARAKDLLSQLSNEVGGLGREAAGAAVKAKQFYQELNPEDFKNLVDYLKNVKNGLLEMVSGADLSSESMVNLTASIASFYLAASGKIELADSIKSMGNQTEETSAKMIQSLSKIMKFMPDMFKDIEGMTGKMLAGLHRSLAVGEEAKNFETALLRQAAAAGNLDEMMATAGDSFENLTNKSLQYSSQARDVATANNITYDTAIKYQNALSQIPGALEQLVKISDKYNTTLSAQDAIIKVASGTFQDHSAVMTEINNLYEIFNNDVEKSLKVVSAVSAASQALDLPMKNVKNITTQAAEAFKFLGDNSQGAIKILGRFSESLKDSGVGPRGIQEIVSNINNMIAKMDVAQRAFVSGKTGGPGGLQGGYQIALDLQQGNVEEVYGRVEETLRDMMGGQIVTLEQAATDARSAAQFTKQVQMLTTGPLAIAGSEGEAFKILEAFAQGTTPEGPEKTPEAALKEAVDRGNAIQEKQLNPLNQIANELEHQSVLASMNLYAMIQGFNDLSGANFAGKFARAESGELAANRKMISDSGPNLSAENMRSKDLVEGKIRQMTGFFQDFNFKDITKNLMPSMGNESGERGQEIISAEDLTGLGARTPEEANQNVTNATEQRTRMAQEGKRRETASTAAGGEKLNVVTLRLVSEQDVERIVQLKFDEAGVLTNSEEVKSKLGSFHI